MNGAKVLSMQSAPTPIKLITALQMIKAEGHTLCVNNVGMCVSVCMSGSIFPFMVQQHAKEEEVISLCVGCFLRFI